MRIARLFLSGIYLSSVVVATAQTQAHPATSSACQQDSTPAQICVIPPRPQPVEANAGGEDRGWLPPGTDPQNEVGWSLVKHLASDQKTFWTSGRNLNSKTIKPFAAFVGFTSLLIATDSWLSKQVPDQPHQLKHSNDISQYGVYAMIGAAGGSYLWGRFTKNEHLREAGFLATETVVNSTAITYALKGITQRERPLEGNGHGGFFEGGASFPSEHSAIAWSIATVMAHEYPGPLTQFLSYGLASTISLTRVTGRQHFPSDVFVGGVLGWYLGRQVYRAHHDPELGGAAWGPMPGSATEKPRETQNMGSSYVPLDSWVYPALERLAAMGYVQTAFLGIRPWTRMECARLLEEAGERMGDNEFSDTQPGKLYAALATEFEPETARFYGAPNLGADLDSIYTRSTQISGPPLRDSYHFGQTIINDYGRPYGEGFNNVSGVSGHAVVGPFAFSVQGEYQHAPSSPSSSPTALQAIANADLTLPVSNAMAPVDRFELLEGSVSFNFHNTQFSFGKQSWWLGPGEAGPLLFSNNAESIVMLKIDSVSPFRIPYVSRVLGPIRTEYFIGQLSGHQFELNSSTLLGPGNINPQPYLDGVKVSFKPTPNLEIGMGFTAQFAGPGLPFTWSNFIRTFYVHSQSGPTTSGNNPGKRLSALDFSYRVPGLRKWLTVYNDSLVVDEISPIGSSRPTVNPGIYMPQIPKLPKLELRAEGVKEPLTSEFEPGFVYYRLRRYRSGYTNNGLLLGKLDRARWTRRARLADLFFFASLQSSAGIQAAGSFERLHWRRTAG